MKELYKFKVMKHGKEDFDKNYFGIFHKKYDYSELSFYYRWFRGWINLLSKFLPLKEGKNKKVLEIGCSIGAFSKHLKQRGFDVEAIDISGFIVTRAQRLQKDIKFKVMDIEGEIKLKKKYDYIFALEVLEHLKNPLKALGDMRALLNKNGVLVFSTPLPTKQTLADPMHINVHGPKYWIFMGKKLKFKKVTFKQVAFIPFFYRFGELFSIGFPTRVNLPFVNNTCFYFFKN